MKKVAVLLTLYVSLTIAYITYGVLFSIEGYTVWHWHLFTSAVVVMPITFFIFAVYVFVTNIILGGDKRGIGFRGTSKWRKKGKNIESGKDGDNCKAV